MAIINSNKDNFNTDVLSSQLPVLVDFWAEWCGPCKMLTPVLEHVQSEIEGTAQVVKIDIDANPELAAQYGVMSIPTLIVFKNGAEVNRAVGVRQKDDLISMLK